MRERKQPQDPHVDDEPGTQPKKYYKGLRSEERRVGKECRCRW